MMRMTMDKFRRHSILRPHIFQIVLHLLAAINITKCPPISDPGCEHLHDRYPHKRFVMHPGTDFCCQYTECISSTVVEPCIEDGGRDTCRRCENGTFMRDNNTSDFLVKCISYNCDPDKATEANVSAQVANSNACGQHCRCDLKKNYCGLNPCQCRYNPCGFEEEMQQDCGCRPRTRIKQTTPDQKPEIITRSPHKPKRPWHEERPENDVRPPEMYDEDEGSHPEDSAPLPENSEENSSGDLSTLTAVSIIVGLVVGLIFAIVLVMAICKYRNEGKCRTLKDCCPNFVLQIGDYNTVLQSYD